MSCNLIPFTKSKAFQDIPFLNEDIKIKEKDKISLKAQEVLNDLTIRLKDETKKTIAFNSCCCLTGMGLLAGGFHALVVNHLFPYLVGTAGGIFIMGASGISTLNAIPMPSKQVEPIRHFSILFQDFMNNPEDLELIPIMKSYSNIIEKEKPCHSVLMKALRQAYLFQNKSTDLTDQWDALLEISQKDTPEENERFDEMNFWFWERFSLPVVDKLDYRLLLKTEGSRLNVPNRLVNILVNRLREECDRSIYSKVSHAFECSETVKETSIKIESA